MSKGRVWLARIVSIYLAACVWMLCEIIMFSLMISLGNALSPLPSWLERFYSPSFLVLGVSLAFVVSIWSYRKMFPWFKSLRISITHENTG